MYVFRILANTLSQDFSKQKGKSISISTEKLAV